MQEKILIKGLFDPIYEFVFCLHLLVYKLFFTLQICLTSPSYPLPLHLYTSVLAGSLCYPLHRFSQICTIER